MFHPSLNIRYDYPPTPAQQNPSLEYNERLESLARVNNFRPNSKIPARSANMLYNLISTRCEIHCGKLYQVVGVYQEDRHNETLIDLPFAHSERDGIAWLVRFYYLGFVCSVRNKVHLTPAGWNYLTGQSQALNAAKWAKEWHRRKDHFKPFNP